MKILGVDPGYERLGIAVLRKEKNQREEALFSECFRTSPKKSSEERLYLVGKRVGEIIKKFKPEILAIETLFMNTNQKTAMRVAEARGIIIYEGTKAGLRIVEASPLEIKVAITGDGRADKKQMKKMMEKLVDLEGDKSSDDELDALAIALTASIHLPTLGYPQNRASNLD